MRQELTPNQREQKKEKVKIKENKKYKKMIFGFIVGIKRLKQERMIGLNTIERMKWARDCDSILRAVKIVEEHLNGLEANEIIKIIENCDAEKMFDEMFKE